MATLEIKNLTGKVVGKHEVSASIRRFEPLAHLLHQAVVTEEANQRQGTQKTKTRSEVSGGGRKPYKQKKTGNARQGSTRSPHYAHGAMALAIMPRSYVKKMNRKERRAAILGAFNAQVDGGNVLVVDKIFFSAPKTKDAANFLSALGLDGVRRVLVVLPAYDEATYKSFRNLENVTVRTAPSNDQEAKTVAFSARDLLVAHKIVVGADALSLMEAVWATEAGEADEKPAKAAKAPKAEKPAKAAKAEAAPAEEKPKASRAKKADAAPAAEAATEEKPKRRTTKKAAEEGEGK
mgnify:CR=1 FL=1